MTNLIKISDHGKAETLENQFTIHFKIECYFQDRSKQLYEFQHSTSDEEQTSGSLLERFEVDCYKHMYAEIDRTKLMLTWSRGYVDLPDGKFKKLRESLPQLHFGYIVEPVCM